MSQVKAYAMWRRGKFDKGAIDNVFENGVPLIADTFVYKKKRGCKLTCNLFRSNYNSVKTILL
ncbi:MAG: hypothetical protein GX416_11805 [Bacteroidales bacterium]|nr:hypothetical protein [Bacteroidales bacterium]